MEDTQKNQGALGEPLAGSRLGEPGTALRVEIGKWYLTRNGRVMGPIAANSENSDYIDTHPFLDKGSGRTYMPNGRYYLNTEESKWDLLYEVPAPVPVSPAPSSEPAERSGAVQSQPEGDILQELVGALEAYAEWQRLRSWAMGADDAESWRNAHAAEADFHTKARAALARAQSRGVTNG